MKLHSLSIYFGFYVKWLIVHYLLHLWRNAVRRKILELLGNNHKFYSATSMQKGAGVSSLFKLLLHFVRKLLLLFDKYTQIITSTIKI